jgi:hypothetical protein
MIFATGFQGLHIMIRPNIRASYFLPYMVLKESIALHVGVQGYPAVGIITIPGNTRTQADVSLSGFC